VSVRQSVCPISRTQQWRAAGLLLSAVRAKDIDRQRRATGSSSAAARRSAANAGNAMLPKHFKVRWAILQTCHFSESFAAKFTNQLIFDLFFKWVDVLRLRNNGGVCLNYLLTSIQSIIINY